jgi:hypothetical protein
MLLLAFALCLQADTDAKVLARINACRKAAGLEPVAIDPALSRGCAAHAKYLVTNAGHASVRGLGAHDEDPKLPGYSEEGKKAAKASDIHFVEPVRAVDGWMASLFHRVPILDPGLRKVGIGYASGGTGGWVSVLDVISGRGGGKSVPVVLYPADGQTGVPLAFGGEIPNPIPDDKDGKAGYPVTASFAEGTPVKEVSASLKADGREVEVWLSTPEKPADERYQRNTVCLMARDVLKPETAYTVTVTGKVGGKAWTKTWSFTTGKP